MSAVGTYQLEKEVVNDVHRIIATTLNIEGAYAGVVAELRKVIDFDRASISLPAEESGCVITYLIETDRRDVVLKKGESYPLEGSIFQKVLSTGGPVIVKDTRDQELSTDILLLREGIRSRLSVPLKVNGRDVGSLNLGSKKPDNFCASHANLLKQITHQLAMLTENTVSFQKTREAEEKYRDLYDNAPTMYCICGIDGTIVECNQSASRLLNYPREHLLGKKIYDFLPLDNHDKMREAIGAGRAEDIELRLSLSERSGDVVTVMASTVPTYGPHGAVSGIRMIMQDITGRKRTEEWLRQEEHKVEYIVDALGIGLCLMNRDLTITWANDRIAELWGLTGPVLGMACPTVFRCTDAVCPAKKAFASGEGRFHDVQVVTRDGQRRYIENIAIPVVNGKGEREVKRVLLLSMDITDRENRIHQLSLLTQLGDALQYTLQSDKVFQLVLTCVTAGHALGFNRAMLFLLSREQDAVCGRMAIGPSNLEQAYEVWQKIKHHTLEGLLKDVAEMGPLASELNIKTKLLAFPVTSEDEIVVRCLNEKEPLVVKDAANDPRVTDEFLNAVGAGEFVCVPLMVKGRAIGVIVADNVYSGEPITAEHVHILTIFAKSAALAIENAETYKELEDKMSQLTETQGRLLRTERLVAVGEMASYVAHEIRNPLVTIGGFARSIERICADDEKINTSSKIIVQEVERLEKILEDIRDFSRPSEPRKTSVRMDGLVKDTLDITEGYLREKGITVERELEHGIPEVLADVAQMKQVFLNLLKNAAESMPGGGTVRVGVCTEGDWVRIRFADTGEGMSSEVMEKLFTPFFTTKSAGTGVGLAISHKIIDDHDGRFNVSSTEGSGSVFSIFIPLHHKGQEARKGGKQ